MKNIRAKCLINASLLSCTLFLSTYTEVEAQRKKISRTLDPDLFGVTLNAGDAAAKGGISAELIPNRSFELPKNGKSNPEGWMVVRSEGADGAMSRETEMPVHPENTSYLNVYAEKPGKAGVGIRNAGFGGIYVKTGAAYHFSVYARETTGNSLQVAVRLVNKDGLTIDEERFEAKGNHWKKYEARLTSPITEEGASLEISLLAKGTLAIDQVSLKPEQTFMNHGFRADIGQAVADLHPKFVRFKLQPEEKSSLWKSTVGKPEERRETSNAPGLLDYLVFCEDLGARAIPLLPIETEGQTLSTEAYIRDVLDLIEFANSTDKHSSWAKMRAKMGHEQAFGISYLALGDQEKISSQAAERFTAVYRAVKSKYPEIRIIGTAGKSVEGSDYKTAWELAGDLKLPYISEQLYENTAWLDENRDRYDFFDREDSKVMIGEFTSAGNDLKSALSEAAFMSHLERNGDVVRLVSYAPVLDEENGLLSFDSKGVYPTINYYVQQLFAGNQGDEYLDRVTYVRDYNKSIAVSSVRDTYTGDVIIKIANNAEKDGLVQIDLRRLPVETRTMQQSMIRDKNGKVENTITNPNAVVPKHRKLKVGTSNFMIDSWANSFMVLRFTGNKSTAMR